MNELSLFSGAGGGLLATKHLLGWNTIGYVEWEDYRQKVIAQRIKDGFLDDAPIFGDIETFISDGYAESYKGLVDVITAGFPCQPHSVAGKQLADKDHRDKWPETARVISIVRPKSVLLENVPGIKKYLPLVIRDLRRIGYTVREPRIIAAAHLGAGHIRRRVWVYAHLDEARRQDAPGGATSQKIKNKWGPIGMGDSKKIPTNPYAMRKLQQERSIKNVRRWACNCSWWETEPDVVRVVYGCPNGVDRIGSLGDIQIPIVAATAWKILTGEYNG